MPADYLTFENCLFHNAATFFFLMSNKLFFVIEFGSRGNNACESQEKKKREREREHQGKILQKYKL